MNVYKSQKCDLYTVHIIRNGLRDRKTHHIQVVQKDMYVYKSQKCDLYTIHIVRYGLTIVVVPVKNRFCNLCMFCAL